MSGVRVYELAQDLGVANKVLIDLLSGMGYPVKSHSSSIEMHLADRLRRQVKKMGLEGSDKKNVAKKAKKEAKKATSKAKAKTDKPAKKKPAAKKSAAKKKAPAKKEEPTEEKAAEKEQEPPRTEEPAPTVVEERQVVREPEPAVEEPKPEPLPEPEPAPSVLDTEAPRKIKIVKPKAVKPEPKPEPEAAPEPKPAATPEVKPEAKEPPKTHKQKEIIDENLREARKKRKEEERIRRKEEEEQRKLEKARKREEEKARKIKEAEEKELQRLIDEEEQARLEEEARKIIIDEATTVKEFAERTRRSVNEIISMLISKGIMATLNQTLDVPVAKELAVEMGLEIITREESELEEEHEEEEDADKLEPRPPVVTIMGHVDHGKTSLLDTIRKTRVTEQEAGGITQSIGAYSVPLEKGNVVFLDTPGHEAFTAMRARGASVTDAVVLVVAADDGVMPQTLEAIHHAKAAEVPVLVAINKIDKPDANPDRIKQDLTAHGLVAEEWGGDTIFCEVSAKQNTGIDNLLEMLLLQAEILELKANPDRMAYGIVVESKLDKGRGPVATVLIQKGTLKVGDAFVSGAYSGKVRAIIDDKGKRRKDAGPSTPVEVLGFSGVPPAGESFMVVESERKANQISAKREEAQRVEGLTARGHLKLETLHAQITQGEIKDLNIIIKADAQGSIEAVQKALADIKFETVRINVLHGAVGGITETDVSLAAASNAIIIGFNVRATEKAKVMAEEEMVDVRFYSVIYNAIDDIRSALEGMLEPVFREEVTGRAEVRDTFVVPKVGTIAGSYVVSGKIVRNSAARLIRDNVVIHTGSISSLKRFKDDAKEVANGYECGIGLEKFNDVKLQDVIETFESVEVERKS